MRDDPEFFVSYKSEDVDFVRSLVERLKAEGHAPWFNEYDIGHKQIDSFQQIIDKGIDGCTWGLLFVNDRYNESPHCRAEVERLLEHLPLARIVVFDRNRQTARFLEKYPQLTGCVTPINGPTEVYAKLVQIRAIPRMPDPAEPLVGPGRSPWHLKEIGALFDPSVWVVDNASLLWQPAGLERLDVTGERRSDFHTFSTTLHGRTVQLAVDYARIEGPFEERMKKRISSTSDGTLRYMEDDQDDRQRLREELDSFESETRTAHVIAARRIDGDDEDATVEEIGVHMFATAEPSGSSRNLYKHRLFSFRLPRHKVIIRVYKLALPQPQLGVPVAVRFVFQFADELQAFFATLPWCDHVARSIRWINRSTSPTLSLCDLERKASEIRGGRHGV